MSKQINFATQAAREGANIEELMTSFWITEEYARSFVEQHQREQEHIAALKLRREQFVTEMGDRMRRLRSV